MNQIVSYQPLSQDELNSLIDSMLVTISSHRYNAREEELAKYKNKIAEKEVLILAKLRGMLRKC